MTVWTEENLKRRIEILKDRLEHYVVNNDVKIKITDTPNIEVQVKLSKKDKFIEDFSPFLEVYDDDECERDGIWYYFDPLALFDAILNEDISCVAFAYALQDLGLGEVPDSTKFQLNKKLKEYGMGI